MLKQLLMFMIGLAGMVNPGASMKEWLYLPVDRAKDLQYDFMATYAFIKNGEPGRSDVFSPLCSEMNILLQAGELAREALLFRDLTPSSPDRMREKAEGHLERIEEEVGEIEKRMAGGKLRVANRAYVPEGLKDALSPTTESRKSFIFYTAEEAERLAQEYVTWVARETEDKIRIGEPDLDGNLLYASVIYFEDEWHEKFDRRLTRAGDFHLSWGRTCRRDFMYSSIGTLFLYRHHKARMGRGFELVALPYKEDKPGSAGSMAPLEDDISRCTRYMVYLIPDGEEPDLSEIWDEFTELAKDGITNLLRQTESDRTGTRILKVPKVKDLGSRLSLNELFKDLYGGGPNLLLESEMIAFIKIDEEGTEAAALAQTRFGASPSMCMPEIIAADRPYIAFVLDSTIDRILFVVKDMGEILPLMDLNK
jgi:serpin B